MGRNETDPLGLVPCRPQKNFVLMAMHECLGATFHSDGQDVARPSSVPITKARQLNMPTAEDYRNSAHECRSHAREAQDRHEREALLRMAAQWDRLAEHKARKEAEQAY